MCTFSAGYARNNTQDYGSAGATFIMDFAADETLELYVKCSSANTISRANETWLCIEYMGSLIAGAVGVPTCVVP